MMNTLKNKIPSLCLSISKNNHSDLNKVWHLIDERLTNEETLLREKKLLKSKIEYMESQNYVHNDSKKLLEIKKLQLQALESYFNK